jgi:hypothetical protein
MPSTPSRPASFWLAPLLVALLLGLQYWMAVSSKQDESTTSDELVHLTGGYTYWQLHDFRMHPENGNLPQRWAALPAWLGGAHPPALDSEYWSNSDVWMFGHEFFYASGNDHVRWLAAGRAMIALFATATGLLIYCWARRLWGYAGAFTALGFYVFCPTFLAHGALITSDMCMTFFFLAAVGAYWRHLQLGSWSSGALSAGVFGLACVAKFSAALLLPMMALMAVVRIWHDEPLQFGQRTWTTKAGKAGVITLSTLGHGLVAVATIWLFYGFRYSAFNPGLPAAEHFIRPWPWVLGNIGLQGKSSASSPRSSCCPRLFSTATPTWSSRPSPAAHFSTAITASTAGSVFSRRRSSTKRPSRSCSRWAPRRPSPDCSGGRRPRRDSRASGASFTGSPRCWCSLACTGFFPSRPT